MSKIRFDIPAALACAGFILGWTIGPIFIKLLTGYMDPWTQNGLRYSVACLFWLPFLLWTIRKGRFPAHLWKAALPVAFVNLFGQSTWAAGFYFSNPAFLVLLSKTCILFVAAISIFVFPDERPLLRNPRFWIGLVLAFAGTFGVVMYHSPSQAEGLFWGTFFALGHSLTFAVYTVLVKIYLKDIDSRVSFAVITLYTAPALMAVAFLMGRPLDTLSLGWKPWSYVVISAVVAIALGHTFFYVAVRRLGASIPSVLLLVIPLTTLIVSYFIFHERLTAVQGLSALLLLAGLTVTLRAEKPTGIESE